MEKLSERANGWLRNLLTHSDRQIMMRKGVLKYGLWLPNRRGFHDFETANAQELKKAVDELVEKGYLTFHENTEAIHKGYGVYYIAKNIHVYYKVEE